MRFFMFSDLRLNGLNKLSVLMFVSIFVFN